MLRAFCLIENHVREEMGNSGDWGIIQPVLNPLPEVTGLTHVQDRVPASVPYLWLRKPVHPTNCPERVYRRPVEVVDCLVPKWDGLSPPFWFA
jgi:hypothetical protein